MMAFMAERCRRSPLLAAITYASRFVALGLLSSSLGAQSQSPPPSALINQRLGDTLERARALSPRTNEESLAYFREDVDAALARALERVWDPTQPRERAPRTTWGDPDLQGYWQFQHFFQLWQKGLPPRPHLIGRPDQPEHVWRFLLEY